MSSTVTKTNGLKVECDTKGIHRCIIDIAYHASLEGKSVHMRTFQTQLQNSWAPASIAHAVKGLADGSVGTVSGFALRHVGRGQYEITEER